MDEEKNKQLIQKDLDCSLDEYEGNFLVKKNEEQKPSLSLKEVGLKQLQENFERGDKDINEIGKQVVHLMSTSDLINNNDEGNQKFKKKFQDLKKEELIESAKKNVLYEEMEKVKIKQRKAEAFYVSYRPILEFDLNHLLVKNSSKKIKYKRVFNKETGRKEKVIVSEEERELPQKNVHSYEERSYGIPLMVMMLLLLTIPYFLCTIVLSIFNVINYIFVAISRFSKPALIICSVLSLLLILGLIVFIIIFSIEGAFHIKIIPRAK